MVQFSHTKGDDKFRRHIEDRIVEILTAAQSLTSFRSALNILSDHGIVVGDEHLVFVERVFSDLYKSKANPKPLQSADFDQEH